MTRERWTRRQREAEYARQLGAAIARAIAEHGSPNRFYLVELARDYGAPAPMHSGRVLRARHAAIYDAAGTVRIGYVLAIAGERAAVVVE